MPQSLKVLIVEDNHAEAERLVEELRRAGFEPDWERVETEEEYLKRLQHGLNIVLSSHQLPQFSGLRALELLKLGGLEIPLIVVSDADGEDHAVAAIKQGAHDYFRKTRLDRLGQSVSQALESSRDRADRKCMEERLLLKGTALATIANAVFITDGAGVIQWVNRAFTTLTGYTEREVAGQTPRLLNSGQHAREFFGDLWATILAGKTWRGCVTNRRKDGSFYHDEQTITPVRSEAGIVTHFVVVTHDVTERQSAEEAVRRQRAEFRVLFDLMPAMIWFKDTENRILRVNKHVADAAGKSVDEIEGKPSLEIYPEESAKFYADDQIVIQSGRPRLGIVESIRSPSGVEVWVQTDKVPVCDKEGKVTGLVVMAQDITARKQTDEALRDKDTLIRITNRITRTGGWAYEISSQRSIWADELFDILEFPPGHPPSLADALALYPEPGRSKIAAAMEACGQQGTPFDVELEIFTAKQRKIWVRVYGEADRRADGTIRGVQGAIKDITKGKQVADSLQRFRALVDQSEDTLEIIDPETGRYLDVNDRGCAAHGYTRDEFLRLNVSNINQGIRAADWPAVRDKIRLEGSRSGDGYHHRKDGTAFPVEFSSKWVRLDRDYIVSVVRDITERKRTEEQALHSQRIENVGLLAAGVAHDLNNILAPMLMASSMLQSHVTDKNDLKLLVMVEKSAQRGASLVRQILGFAHGVGGEQQLLQVKHVLHDIASIIVQTFPKLIVFEEQLSGNLRTINANPTQIHQVLLNLCINARDAMPAGGKLILRAENCSLDADAARAIKGSSPGDWLKLEVSDTGTGIPPEVLARIWEPFFTTKEPGKGTGLGLSTVLGIVERHQGFITAQSDPGHGTTFSVYFPAAEGVLDTSAPMPRAARGRGELILVVDDEESMRAITTDILTQHNYRVLVAGDGIDGVALVAKHTLELRLVITDFNMPGLNGENFARVVRSLNPAIKIIGMSGGNEGRLAANSPEPFADVFLVKPFKAETLLANIETLLQPAMPGP